MAHYEAVIPGLADRLITRFEKQSDHPMELEKAVTRSDALRANVGLAAGFTIALTAIIAGAYCIIHGHDWAGFGLDGAALGGLVGTFVYGTNSRRGERLDRQKILTSSTDNETEEKND